MPLKIPITAVTDGYKYTHQKEYDSLQARERIVQEFTLETSTILSGREIVEHLEDAIKKLSLVCLQNGYEIRNYHYSTTLDDSLADGNYTNRVLKDMIYGAYVAKR